MPSLLGSRITEETVDTSEKTKEEDGTDDAPEFASVDGPPPGGPPDAWPRPVREGGSAGASVVQSSSSVGTEVSAGKDSHARSSSLSVLPNP